MTPNASSGTGTLSRRAAMLAVSSVAMAAALLVGPARAQAQTGGAVTAPAGLPTQTADLPGEPAPAPASPTANQTNEVVVTGSRITSSGFSAPTPTQVIGAQEIAKLAEPNLFDAVTQLPSLMGSTGRATSVGTTSSGVQGLSSFSLRGLGAIRTLTLLDGQRFVGANVTGVPDVSQFPQLLISRVDVVTGGASASYGSDAVGGVVNFITDKRFKGFKANLEGGITTYGDDKDITAQAAWGGSAAHDTLHFEVSGEYSYEGGVPNPGFGIVGANGRRWYVSPAFQVTNPIAAVAPGQPQYHYIEQAQQFQYAKYGLITAGPLQGTAFGPGGQPFQFQYGSNGVPSKTASGAVLGCVTPFCSGGDTSGVVGGGTTLASKLQRIVGYGRLGWDWATDNEVYATLNIAQVKSENSPNPGAAQQANITIQCSNPFVPASVQQACTDNNITSFQFGTSLANFPEFIKVKPTRTNVRGVIGATGKFGAIGTKWSYDAYYEYGTNYTNLHVYDIALMPRFRAAIQAARQPDGSIVCASAAARAAGCVPFNIIGDVENSQAALDYIEPAIGPFQRTRSSQNAASISINGQPLSSWAGPIAVAFGYEFRREAYRVDADPYGNGVYPGTENDQDYPADPLLNTTTGNNWYAGNYHTGSGRYNVHEGFVEVDVPLADSDALGRANLNAGFRDTRYSTSGWITSWKVGGTWDTPLKGIRLRAITSRDVRAPNLSELFAAPVFANATFNNPSNGTTINTPQLTLGNPALVPEVGRNTNAGIVLANAPWFPGFSISFDYYRIKVRNVISTLDGQAEVNYCAQGVTTLCSFFNLDPAAGPVFLNVQAFNLASIYTNGFDIEASYRRPLSGLRLPGSFTVRGLATHVIHYRSDTGLPGAIPTEAAGNNRGSIPHWKVLATESWDTDTVSLTLVQRWFSDGVYDTAYIECNGDCPVSTGNHPTVDRNHMDGAFYLDIGGSYRFSQQVSAFFKIDNALDRDPTPSPSTGAGYGANPALYDVLGRTFRVGARFRF